MQLVLPHLNVTTDVYEESECGRQPWLHRLIWNTRMPAVERLTRSERERERSKQRMRGNDKEIEQETEE